MSHKILVTKTLRWHLKITRTKDVLDPEVVPAFALSFASLHLRNTHLRSDVNLLEFAPPI